MTNVQIAIRDRRYAQALLQLLSADGQHRVYQVEFPSPAIDGVVVADETITDSLELQEGVSLDRYVFFTRKLALELDKLWAAGVRHVIHADCPPHLGRLVVLAAERRLEAYPKEQEKAALADQPEIDTNSLFDETDRLFLQALNICVR